MKRILTILGFTLALNLTAFADEGMWMVHCIDKALEKNMRARGLKLKAREIYDADARGASLSDAVVALDFACTGSVISDEGLLITNHHCAYADVHAMSTPEKNYLEDGFWAFRSEEERPVPGKKVYFLKKVLDVTDEVESVKKDYAAQGRRLGMRKLGWEIEKKYRSVYPGLEASLSSMWAGEKYYLCLYRVYGDVRLVAAPPVSIAAFGGDADNWEWPQHKCDFALYRIYTSPDGEPAKRYSQENVPLNSPNKLKISLDGYKEGSFAMVLGYPGTTSRYSSSAENSFDAALTLPISNRLRAAQMEIIRRGMDSSPKVRLLYADRFFSLSNVQELQEGEVECIRRFSVVENKVKEEAELNRWIREDAGREAKWGALTEDLRAKYAAIAEAEKDIAYYRETLVRGSRMGMTAIRISNILSAAKKRGLDSFTGKDFSQEYRLTERLYNSIDLPLEKELFTYSLVEFFRNVSPEMFSGYQKELYRRFCEEGKNSVSQSLSGGNNEQETPDDGLSKMADWLWENSILSHREHLEEYLREEHKASDYSSDPLYRFFDEIHIVDFNKRVSKIEGENKLSDLRREYIHALYEMRLEKGTAQYPDANSTLRLTYGRVGGLAPRDGVRCDFVSTTKGVLEKNNPAVHDFCLKEDWKGLLESGDCGQWGASARNAKKCATQEESFPVNFLCDCDITGGNSGSPVLNSSGELIGLAFDGNKESLASDVAYTPSYNKCVCVDIRYVLFTLGSYAHLDRILSEIFK